jgi:hypothetical protein
MPPEARLLEQFSVAFTAPTFERFLLLGIGAIVCLGRRTVSRILWTMRTLLEGHPSSYHRVFSRRRWSLWPLAKVLAEAVLALLPADQPVTLVLDDTVDGPHRGKRVYGHGCWRDAVISSGTRLALRWGHRWVVLCVNVQFPFATRPWALPVLVALVRKEALDRAEHRRRHKSPPRLGQQLLAVLLHWFPQRRFIVLGDAGFGSHGLACFCAAHHPRLTLIARCCADTNLWSLPRRPRRSKGGWQKKGHKLPSPRQTVSAMPQQQRVVRAVAWYGGGGGGGARRRALELVSGCGGWYTPRGVSGRPLPLRWVFVRDPATAREDYFYSTDPTLPPQRIVELFEWRWPIEVTLQELRAWLGLQTTRSRTRQSVLRQAPCLFGLFSVVSLIYAQLAKGRAAATATATAAAGAMLVRQMPWYHKSEPTFSDALFAVRRLLWTELLMHHRCWNGDTTPLPPRLKTMIIEYLSDAA